VHSIYMYGSGHPWAYVLVSCCLHAQSCVYKSGVERVGATWCALLALCATQPVGHMQGGPNCMHTTVHMKISLPSITYPFMLYKYYFIRPYICVLKSCHLRARLCPMNA